MSPDIGPTCAGRGPGMPRRSDGAYVSPVESAPPASAPLCRQSSSSATQCSSPCRRSPASPVNSSTFVMYTVMHSSRTLYNRRYYSNYLKASDFMRWLRRFYSETV